MEMSLKTESSKQIIAANVKGVFRARFSRARSQGLVTRTHKPAAAASCHPAEALVSVHCSRSYNSSLWSYDFDEGLEEDLKLVHITPRAPRDQGGVRGVGCSSTDGQSIGAHHAQQALWSGKGGDHVEVNWINTVCCLSSNQTVRGQFSGSLEHSSSQ